MKNKKMTHELDQLAAMFWQLGKVAAQRIGSHSPTMVGKNEHGQDTVRKAGFVEPQASLYEAAGDIETV